MESQVRVTLKWQTPPIPPKTQLVHSTCTYILDLNFETISQNIAKYLRHT